MEAVEVEAITVVAEAETMAEDKQSFVILGVSFCCLHLV
jgi:hypothetical protein